MAKSNKQLLEEVIEDFEKRKKVIADDDAGNFNSTIGKYMQTGAIMAINDAITLIKEQIKKL